MRIRPNHEQNVRLTVRPLASEDLDGYIAYFTRPSKADAERMGLAIDRVPPATRLRSELEAMIAAPSDRLHSLALAWCVDGKTIGHSSLKDLVPGDFAGGQHLFDLLRLRIVQLAVQIGGQVFALFGAQSRDLGHKALPVSLWSFTPVGLNPMSPAGRKARVFRAGSPAPETRAI